MTKQNENRQSSTPRVDPLVMRDDALELIYLTDWGWEGGGSDRRVMGKYGRIAALVLGMGDLPDGWPTNDARLRIAELQKRLGE